MAWSIDGHHSSLRWRHNGRDSVSNHQPYYCLLSRLFRRRWKKTSKFRVTGLYAGKSPGTGEFPAQMASNAEIVSIWWRHHVVENYRNKTTIYASSILKKLTDSDDTFSFYYDCLVSNSLRLFQCHALMHMSFYYIITSKHMSNISIMIFPIYLCQPYVILLHLLYVKNILDACICTPGRPSYKQTRWTVCPMAVWHFYRLITLQRMSLVCCIPEAPFASAD